jgi:hypothetical protein
VVILCILPSSWSILIPILLPEVFISCILPSSWSILIPILNSPWGLFYLAFYAYCYLLGHAMLIPILLPEVVILCIYCHLLGQY